jgi:peroxiredoxin
MFAKSKKSLVVLAGMIIAAAAAGAAGPLPLFRGLNGESRTLEQFLGAGKWVLVAVWGSDCYVCNLEAHHLVNFHAARNAQDAMVVGISTDGANPQAAERFIAKNKLNFPNLIGTPGDISRLAYASGASPFRGTPTHYLFSPGGQLVAVSTGSTSQSQIEQFIEQLKSERPVAGR